MNRYIYYGFCAAVGIVISLYARVLSLDPLTQVWFGLTVGLPIIALWIWANEGKDIEEPD